MLLGLDSSRAEDSAGPVDGLIAALLRDQGTAAETFSHWHDTAVAERHARHYRHLIPLLQPGPGEQFAFEVDLDACSGCKSCVAACHNLNGLEEDELWRSVGLLHGGANQLAVLQHVTTACHHCVEPACLDGCPVNAYEKDPLTGIVRHLDDQCIGCRYCIFKCPYDVPKYSPSKGIVRKCDMCRTRLGAGEAPACVQACPNQAIRITVVSKQEVADNAQSNLFLPGAPEPGYTLPTTVYRTRKALPANLLPADYFAASPQHAHWALVWMLVLTQMSVGAFLVDQGLSWWDAGNTATSRAIHLGSAFVLGMIGLGAAVLHLGRPLLAYRAVIGWRTSWLSREVLAFAAFALLASLYAATPWLESPGVEVADGWRRAVGAAVALSGLAGVGCSVMIYASTRRAFWNPALTGLKFLLTCVVLGVPVAMLLRLAPRVWQGSPAGDSAFAQCCVALCISLMIGSGVKLLTEATVFCWLRARTFTPLKRTALLMTGELGRVTLARFAAGLLGGLALPLLLILQFSAAPGPSNVGAAGPQAVLTLSLIGGIFLLCAIGEVLERYLFFAAVVVPKMPGAPAT